MRDLKHARDEEQATATGARRARSLVVATRALVVAALAAAYAVLWTGGVGHYLFVGAVVAEQNWLASVFLGVAGALVLCATTSRADFLRLLAVAGFGLLIELCGVRYGMPFGRYAYTGVLQPVVFGVPVVMAFAWMTLIAYLQQARLRLRLSSFTGALVAAAWMTAIDLVIDPLAANQLGYWRWVERGVYYGIPLSNFAGWFAASLSIFALLPGRAWRANRWHRLAGVSIVLFFTLIALSFRLWTAAGVGIVLCAFDVLLHARRRRSP